MNKTNRYLKQISAIKTDRQQFRFYLNHAKYFLIFGERMLVIKKRSYQGSLEDFYWADNFLDSIKFAIYDAEDLIHREYIECPNFSTLVPLLKMRNWHRQALEKKPEFVTSIGAEDIVLDIEKAYEHLRSAIRKKVGEKEWEDEHEVMAKQYADLCCEKGF